MTNPPPFKASIRPALNAEGQRLVNVYNGTYGATAPGCCPEAVAAVLRDIAATHYSNDPKPIDLVLIARSLEGTPDCMSHV